MKTAIHVPTEEDSRKLQEYLFKKGYLWSGYMAGYIHAPNACYGMTACINISPYKTLMYSDKSYYEREGYEIISLDEFFKRENAPLNSSFYMVWRSGGESPKKRHATEQEAIDEAHRLSAKHPGAELIILKSIGSVKAVKSTFTRHT